VIDNSDYSISDDEGGFRIRSVFPYDSLRRFEIYYVEIDPGMSYEANAHPEETQEFIMVFSGILEVNVNNHELIIREGSSARFKSDSPHKYRNTGSDICKMSMVMYYPK